MSSIVFLLEDDWNEKIVVSEWAMSLSGLQNERMPDRWDNIGGKISTETQNKTALTEGTSIKTERQWPHGWTKHVIWSYISYPPTYWTTYLLVHLYLTTNKTINCGSRGLQPQTQIQCKQWCVGSGRFGSTKHTLLGISPESWWVSPAYPLP